MYIYIYSFTIHIYIYIRISCQKEKKQYISVCHMSPHNKHKKKHINSHLKSRRSTEPTEATEATVVALALPVPSWPQAGNFG